MCIVYPPVQRKFRHARGTLSKLVTFRSMSSTLTIKQTVFLNLVFSSLALGYSLVEMRILALKISLFELSEIPSTR